MTQALRSSERLIPVSATYEQWPGLQSVIPGVSRLRSLRRLRASLGWVPSSLRDNSWAGCGNLALKELPTELYLLLFRTRTLEGESRGLCPFWSEQRTTFIWRDLQEHRYLTMT